jgi:transcriptional repressor NrdR
MNCPNCGKTDNKVIDSRLSKDGNAIRRRRQCLICSSRFTTWEAIEERLLPFLVSKLVKQGTTATNLKSMLSFMSNTLKILSKETENLIKKVEKHERARAAEEAKKRVRERKIAKRRAKSLMMTETVLKIIRRHKKGVDISKLKDKTGFDNRKIYYIVHKLKKQGKVKSGGIGIYLKVL